MYLHSSNSGHHSSDGVTPDNESQAQESLLDAACEGRVGASAGAGGSGTTTL
jgi:hypothetical protein